MSRQSNFVSVIIPCYNHGRYLPDAIASILAQTWPDYEIIVVDDGSDDPKTLQVLEEITDSRVKVFHTPNGHLSAARNFGIRQSRGEYILTLDADDKFAPEFLEKAVRVLRDKSRVGVVTCFVRTFGSSAEETFLPEGGGVTNFLLKNNCCGNSLFRYQCWVDAGGYDESMRGFEDWNFWIGVTKNDWLVHTIPEFLFQYRDTDGSMSKAVQVNRPELYKKIVSNHSEVFREYVVDVLYAKEKKIKYLRECLLRRRNTRSTIRSFLRNPVTLIKSWK